MQFLRIRLSIFLCLLFVLVAPARSDDWRPVVKTGEVKVWEEVTSSPVNGVRAEMIVEAPPAELWAVLQDTSAWPDFMPYVEEVRELGDHADGAYFYQRVKLPFIPDRDFVMKVVDEADFGGGHFKRSWQASAEYPVAARKGVIRVTENAGSWSVSPIGAGRSKLVYLLRADPGGNLPAALIAKANRKAVKSVVKAVAERAER